MVTLTVSKIASIYSTDAIISCHVEKKYDICINADVLPKYPKIGITVGSLLKLICIVLNIINIMHGQACFNKLS